MRKIFIHFLGKYVVHLHEHDRLDIYALRTIHRKTNYKSGHKKSIPRKMKWAVWKRDGYKCVYCLTTNGPFSVDHIVPECQGGKMSMTNFVTACFRCNGEKDNRSYEEFINSKWLAQRSRDIRNGSKTKRNNKSSHDQSQHRSRLLGV